jgi:hypothetical protein
LSLLLRKHEEFTEIPDFFVEDRVGLWFPTRIGIASIVEGAVATTAEVYSARRTSITPTDALFDEDFLLTLITGLHHNAPCHPALSCIFVLVQQEVN